VTKKEGVCKREKEFGIVAWKIRDSMWGRCECGE
jgi:hypothetical protein